MSVALAGSAAQLMFSRSRSHAGHTLATRWPSDFLSDFLYYNFTLSQHDLFNSHQILAWHYECSLACEA